MKIQEVTNSNSRHFSHTALDNNKVDSPFHLSRGGGGGGGGGGQIRTNWNWLLVVTLNS